MKTIAQIYNLETKKQIYLKANVRANVKVIQAVLSPDDTTLILIGQAKFTSAFVYSANGTKYKHAKTITIDKAEAQGFFTDRKAIMMQIIDGNKLAHSGVSYDTQKNVYLCDLSSGERLVEFNLSKHYCVDMMEVSKDLKTVVACTADSCMINGDDFKPITVIDAEKSRVRCTCDGSGPYSAVAFCGDRGDLLATCGQQDSAISVWFIGSDAVDGILLLSLYGHAEMVTYLQVATLQISLFFYLLFMYVCIGVVNCLYVDRCMLHGSVVGNT